MLMTIASLALCAMQSTALSAPREAPPATNAVACDVPQELAAKLLNARRVFVEDFGEGSLDKTLQAMLIDAMRTSKRFIVTENREKADLVLKGAALEKSSQELHATGSSTSVAGAAGGYQSSIDGRPAHVSGSASGGFIGRALGIEDSEASIQAVHDARVAVRLVSNDGDVVWSTTQESKGAKYKSATADVADKIVKQLLRDIQRLTSPKDPRAEKAF